MSRKEEIESSGKTLKHTEIIRTKSTFPSDLTFKCADKILDLHSADTRIFRESDAETTVARLNFADGWDDSDFGWNPAFVELVLILPSKQFDFIRRELLSFSDPAMKISLLAQISARYGDVHYQPGGYPYPYQVESEKDSGHREAWLNEISVTSAQAEYDPEEDDSESLEDDVSMVPELEPSFMPEAKPIVEQAKNDFTTPYLKLINLALWLILTVLLVSLFV